MSRKSKINRRDFLQSTAQGAGALAGMDWYVRALLAGALVPSISRASMGGGTGDPNFLFISLPGGYDPTLLFDPKLFHILRGANGAPLTMNPLNNETVNNPNYVAPVARTELAPRPVVDALEYLNRVTLPGNPPDAGTHVYHAPPDYSPPERTFSELESTPPRFTRGEISLGPCAGPLLEYASRTTICRGVIPSTQHDTAGPLLWTGHTDPSSVARATVDCLVAARLRGSALMPHVLMNGMSRHGYVSQNVPSSANTVQLPGLMPGASDVMNYLRAQFRGRKIDSLRTTPYKQALLERIQSSFQLNQARARDPLARGILQDLNDKFAMRESLAGNELDSLEGVISGFITAAQSELWPYYSRTRSSDPIIGVPGDSNYNGLSAAWLSHWRYTVAAAATATALLSSGKSSVAVLPLLRLASGSQTTDWDSHGTHYPSRVCQDLEFCMIIVRMMLQRLDLGRTTVVFLSDTGREPIIDPVLLGKNHNNSTSIAIIGGPLGNGRVFGGTDAMTRALNINPTTGAAVTSGGVPFEPKHVLAALLRTAQYSDAEIQTWLGIAPPAFLRTTQS